MSVAVKKYENDVVKQVVDTLKKYPELVRKIAANMETYHIQDSEHDLKPPFYYPGSDSRYADSYPSRFIRNESEFIKNGNEFYENEQLWASPLLRGQLI